ncbi:MAG: hypothetical protein PVG16_06350, partial [Chromatiales bacterium]
HEEHEDHKRHIVTETGNREKTIDTGLLVFPESIVRIPEKPKTLPVSTFSSPENHAGIRYSGLN